MGGNTAVNVPGHQAENSYRIYALVQLYHTQSVLEDIIKTLKFIRRRRKQ
jgi:hypothetical protein